MRREGISSCAELGSALSSSGVPGRSWDIRRTNVRSLRSGAAASAPRQAVPPASGCTFCLRSTGRLTAPVRWGNLPLRRHPLTCWGFGWSRPEAPFLFPSQRPRARPYLNSLRPSGRTSSRRSCLHTLPPPCLLHDRKRPLLPPSFVQRSPPLLHPRPSNLIGFGRPLTGGHRSNQRRCSGGSTTR